MSGRTMGATRRSAGTFYTGLALAFAVSVFVGFAPTFYLKPWLAAPPLNALVMLHGVVFTAWILLFATQATLVARGRTDLHRRLGVAGAALAAGMVVLGLATAIDMVRRGVSPPGAPPPLSFFAIPFFSIVAFGILVAAAVLLRRNSGAHKRLMVLATIAMLPAAIARWPLPGANIPPVFLGLSDLFILACMVHDLRTRGRVHPATIWGGLFVVLLQPLQLAILGTAPWLGFARWLTG
jgi:hypothetical protein